MSHRVQIAGSDVAFTCEPGQSLLEAGLQAGVEMPYSCRKGVCGNCAGTVAQGAVQGCAGVRVDNEYCAPGQVLFCRCTPTCDVVLAPTSWRRVAPGACRQLTVKVYRHQRVADDVSVLQLRLPAGQRVKFRAGQYLEVLLDDGSRRSYSMANAPHENDAVTLHIRHIEGGRFSARVPQLQPGDPLRIELPLGSFSLREDSGRALVFVAGGTGFAPIKSMLDDMVKRGIRRPVTLFWGARDASGLYLLPAVERWQRALPGFRFVRALSGAAHDQPGDVFRGRLDAAVLAACPTLVDHALYCCGSPAMVAAVREACIAQRGLAASDFHSDAFVSSGTTEMQPTHASRSA